MLEIIQEHATIYEVFMLKNCCISGRNSESGACWPQAAPKAPSQLGRLRDSVGKGTAGAMPWLKGLTQFGSMGDTPA